MQEEKIYYTITELVNLGFSRYELLCATRIEGQTYATRAVQQRGATWKFNLQEYIESRKQRQLARC